MVTTWAVQPCWELYDHRGMLITTVPEAHASRRDLLRRPGVRYVVPGFQLLLQEEV